MSDVESFTALAKQLLAAVQGLANAMPAWRETLGILSDLTPGTMRYHAIEASSGTFWDQVAADLELPRLEAARLTLLDVRASRSTVCRVPRSSPVEGAVRQLCAASRCARGQAA